MKIKRNAITEESIRSFASKLIHYIILRLRSSNYMSMASKFAAMEFDHLLYNFAWSKCNAFACCSNKCVPNRFINMKIFENHLINPKSWAKIWNFNKTTLTEINSCVRVSFGMLQFSNHWWIHFHTILRSMAFIWNRNYIGAKFSRAELH